MEERDAGASVVTGRGPGAPADGAGHPGRWGVMCVLGAVSFMAQLDFFIVNVALAGIGKTFPGSTVSELSWVLDAYAVVFAAVLVPAGRIADLRGRKKVLLAGVALFTCASALASFAPGLGVLVAARAVQAVGAAMIVPTSLGLLYPSFPRRQHTLVVGLWAGVAAVAASAGPPVGGLLVTIDWRWIFLVNLPIGVVTIIAGAVLLPEVREPRGRGLPDPVSAVTFLLAVGLVILAIVQGPHWGWTGGRTAALFAAGCAAAAVTVWRIRTAPAPIVEKTLFRSRRFTAATVALFLFFTGFGIFLLGSALFMQEVWHFTPLETGLGLAPAPIFAIVFAVGTGPIQRRFGATLPAVAGTVTMAVAAGYWLLAAHDRPAYWTALFPGLILMGISGGLSQAPLFAAAGGLSPDRATTGSAVLTMSRQVGGAVGVALLVALTAEAGAGAATGYHRAWCVQAGCGLLAAVALLLLRPARSRRP
ncbi:MFS transporter [Microtetraspora sp. NBRC 13810]|uniref:MFS transporter n=1 Tax=Microtetraspora sp. NBRC 13810 TaxID=3030990 RepID=UPI0024A41C0B|nr:MFS transporter [Microtetraspora sp. NBRC 13810]GLW09097.1 MFS transporter [Microtetraspora sp. NBRC 13810]